MAYRKRIHWQKFGPGVHLPLLSDCRLLRHAYRTLSNANVTEINRIVNNVVVKFLKL